MQFITIDVAHMINDGDGFKYLLMIGCIFSKFIEAVGMHDQTAPTIVGAIWEHWITKHGCPQYILSDQGSNVDGETIREICSDFYIQKRRTSGYHSQGNGFAERNTRSVREMLRTLLLDKQLPQNHWSKLLPSIVFSLNSSESTSTKCIPFEALYGRVPNLPCDIIFDTVECNISAASTTDYIKDLKVQLRETIKHVNKELQVSRKRMQNQYNKNIVFHDYQQGDRVWLHKKSYKTGENRKLSPRKTGPWIIERKMGNGVNFEIKKNSQVQIVHHNRLTPCVISDDPENEHGYRNRHSTIKTLKNTNTIDQELYHTPLYSSSDSEPDSELEQQHRYPVRIRRPRIVEGAIPWDVADDIL